MDVLKHVCFYICDWFNTVPTAKQNMTPVIHGNWEPGYMKPALKALWHEVRSGWISTREIWKCLWSNSPLKIDICNLILNCLILFARVEIMAKMCFHCHPQLPVFFPVHTSTRLAERACSFSATPRFIFAVRHIHTHSLLTLDRSLGLSVWLMGISVAAPEKAVSHVFTFNLSRN